MKTTKLAKVSGLLKLPHLDKLKIGDVLSVTLSPAYQPDIGLDSFIHWYKAVRKDVLQVSNNIVLYVERQNRFHFHGYITITNLSTFIFHDIDLLKNIGQLDIDTIDDMDVWLEYCTKSASLHDIVNANLKKISTRIQMHPIDNNVFENIRVPDKEYLINGRSTIDKL